MPDWKIDKRKARCGSCDREFESREEHYSAIVQTPEGFRRRDFCIRCWDGKSAEPFSYWRTESPEKQERRLENVQAMIDFFCRLTSGPLEDGTRAYEPSALSVKLPLLVVASSTAVRGLFTISRMAVCSSLYRRRVHPTPGSGVRPTSALP